VIEVEALDDWEARMSRARCMICGEKVEQDGRSSAGSGPSVCYGCYLDGLVPGQYRFLEGYAFDEVWGHVNATARPGTGVPVLDLPHPPRISDTWLKASILKHLGEIEARMGLAEGRKTNG
jgi:hypothetical protein